MHHKPILNLSLPLLITEPRRLGKPESPKNPAEHHAHLHHRKMLPCAVRGSIREREERSWIVLPRRCTRAEPSFWQERVGCVEVSRVTLNAVDVNGDLCLLGDNPARWMHIVRNYQINGGVCLRVPFAEHFFASSLVYRALRPARNRWLKAKALVAIQGVKN